MRNTDWPFIIVRSYGDGVRNHNALESVFEANERHPGLVNEIWFSGSSLNGVDDALEKARNCLPYRERCEKSGIQFSYQQGVTLNHGPDFVKRPHFSDEAWMVDSEGKLLVGMLCPTSPEAKQYNFDIAKTIMEAMQPASYWPDDDLRLSLRGGRCVCFCERCIAEFNRWFHHAYTRPQLVDALFGEHSQEDLTAIRTEWTSFNAAVLGEFSTVYRKAADEVAPDCRIGMQTVFANCIYDGPDFKPLLEGIASREHPFVGIRPGSGYYCERDWMGCYQKALHVMREATRCNRYGFVAQICYEAENWPHVAREKTPLSQMNECALMLASGADSLALYYSADDNAEPPEIARFYFDTLAQFHPYFEKIVATFKNTMPTGAAMYYGSQFLGLSNWMSLDDDVPLRLLENSIPVCPLEGNSELFVLDERFVGSLGNDDLSKCFSKTVLMDVPAWRKLEARFPKLNFLEKVQIREDIMEASAFSTFNLKESFNGHLATSVTGPICIKSPDVKAFSTITGVDDLHGICTIPTEFGGSVVLIQTLDYFALWTAYRREAIMNAIDSVLPGKMSARLGQGGFSVMLYSRVNTDGKTAGIYLENMHSGDTLAHTLAIRRPVSNKWFIACASGGMADAEAEILSASADEIILRLPPFAPHQSFLVYPK